MGAPTQWRGHKIYNDDENYNTGRLAFSIVCNVTIKRPNGQDVRAEVAKNGTIDPAPGTTEIMLHYDMMDLIATECGFVGNNARGQFVNTFWRLVPNNVV